MFGQITHLIKIFVLISTNRLLTKIFEKCFKNFSQNKIEYKKTQMWI